MPDLERQLRKPEACPKCHGTDVRRILYGKLASKGYEMVERGEAVPGGCFVEPWLPDWRCEACRHKWFDPDDPAKQEIEQMLERIIQRARAKQTEKAKG